MSFIYNAKTNAAEMISSAINKARKASLINKIHSIIEEEQKASDEAYILLGRHYYENLRNKDDEELEFYCREIDYSSRRIERAMMKLSEITYDEDISHSFLEQDFSIDENDAIDCDLDCQSGGDCSCAGTPFKESDYYGSGAPSGDNDTI